VAGAGPGGRAVHRRPLAVQVVAAQLGVRVRPCALDEEHARARRRQHGRGDAAAGARADHHGVVGLPHGAGGDDRDGRGLDRGACRAQRAEADHRPGGRLHAAVAAVVALVADPHQCRERGGVGRREDLIARGAVQLREGRAVAAACRGVERARRAGERQGRPRECRVALALEQRADTAVPARRPGVARHDRVHGRTHRLEVLCRQPACHVRLSPASLYARPAPAARRQPPT